MSESKSPEIPKEQPKIYIPEIVKIYAMYGELTMMKKQKKQELENIESKLAELEITVINLSTKE